MKVCEVKVRGETAAELEIWRAGSSRAGLSSGAGGDIVALCSTVCLCQEAELAASLQGFVDIGCLKGESGGT